MTCKWLRFAGLPSTFPQARCSRTCFVFLPSSEVFGLLGLDGAGKIALFRLSISLLKPTSGVGLVGWRYRASTSLREWAWPCGTGGWLAGCSAAPYRGTIFSFGVQGIHQQVSTLYRFSECWWQSGMSLEGLLLKRNGSSPHCSLQRMLVQQHCWRRQVLAGVRTDTRSVSWRRIAGTTSISRFVQVAGER